MQQADSDTEFIKNSEEDISVYRFLPVANPIIASLDNVNPEVSQPKIIIKEPLRTVFNRRKFQPPSAVCSQLPSSTPSQKQLVKEEFDWQFQSGNLLSSIKIQPGLYRLTLRPDSNSRHQSLWFYFRVRGIKSGRFILSPFKKPTSLFNQGMKVCVKQQSGPWTRSGEDINYQLEGDHHILKFSLEFPNPNEWTYVSYCFPYTYEQLNSYLARQQARESKLLRKEVFAKSSLKRNLHLLTFKEEADKPVILITARVHPGQSVSSHVMKGVMDKLFERDKNTAQLLRNYQIRIVPIINPDGVALGNYRCSSSGHDLNRRWKGPRSTTHPEIYQLKKQISMIGSRICMVIDIHGHSRKKGVFFYGCCTPGENASKQFPYLMQKCYPEVFSFRKSSFHIQPSKEGTLRVSLWKKLRIPWIYTMECSFCGSELKDNYLPEDFEKVGRNVVEGLTVFYSGTFEHQLEELKHKQTSIKETFEREKQTLVNDQDESGSDSEPSAGCRSQQSIQQIKLTHLSRFQQSTPSRSRDSAVKTGNVVRFQSTVGSQQKSQKTSPSKPFPQSRQRKSFSQVARPNSKKSVCRMDQKLSNRLQFQNKSNVKSLQNEEANIRSTILLGIRRKNEKNIGSQKLMNMLVNGPEDCMLETNRPHTTSNNFHLALPRETLWETSRPTRRRQLFGTQYIRIKKYAQKISKQKYSLSRVPRQQYNDTVNHWDLGAKAKLLKPLCNTLQLALEGQTYRRV